MRRLLAALALIALGAGLWWLWSADGRGTSASAPRSHSPAGPEPAPDVELERPAPAPEELAPDSRPAQSAREELARDEGAAGTRVARPAGELDLVVRVVDPAGTPRAGIPVRLDPAQEVPPEVAVPGEEVTDSAGRAVFRGVRRALERAPAPWTLRHELHFEDPPRLLLDAATLAAPEVVSVLPWGGPLEVVVRELDGAPAPRGSKLELRLVRPEDEPDGEPSGPEWKVTLEGGTARFPWVQLGRRWQCTAWRPVGLAPSRTRASGPHERGESARIEVVLGADHPVVSFRVLDERLQPLASASMEVGRRSLFRSLDKIELETDAAGRFTVDGEAGPFGSDALLVTHRRADGSVLQGRARLPHKPAVGWNDGGDVPLAGEPLLCAGRVVDAGGRPVPEAEVVAGDEPRWPFGDSGTVRERSDEAGRFELRGLWDQDELPLHAEASGQRSEDVNVRQGSTGVELVLTARHKLRGTLLVDPGIDPGAIRFELQPPGAEPFRVEREQQHVFFQVQRDPPEVFRLEPVPAGTYDLVLELEGIELARLERLALYRDLDLGPVDLRGLVKACEIELVGAADAEDVAGEYSWWPDGSGEARGGSFSGRLVRIATPVTPIDVELRPRGYRQARLEDVSGRCRHELEGPLRVRIVLETDGKVPAPPYSFGCQLYRSGSSMGEKTGANWFTRENRELAFLVSEAGSLEVRWHLERRIEGASFGGAMGTHVLEEHWREIEVHDVPGEQLFRVHLDGAALDELAREPPF